MTTQNDIRLNIMEAIARKKAVSARYNGDVIKLAPHFLFERHGELFVGALNLSKAWRTEEERRLGQFKLAGLGESSLLDESFDTLPTYSPDVPRAGDTLVLAL